MAAHKPTSTRDHGGLIAAPALECGKFYVSVQCGGFTDVVSGLHVPGPVAIVDSLNKQIIGVELRAPIQLPHAKIAYNPKDRAEKIEVPFFEYNELGESALQMACNTGIIVHVPDEEVQALWPEAWATRQEHIVFDPFKDARTNHRPILDLIGEAKAKLAEARDHGKAAQAEAAQAAAK